MNAQREELMVKASEELEKVEKEHEFELARLNGEVVEGLRRA